VGEVVLLVVDNALCRVAARSLAGRFPDLKIIVEAPAPQKVELPSLLWSHPTLWGYVATGLERGAW